MKQKIGYFGGFFFSVVLLFSAAQAFAAEEDFPLVQVSCKPELTKQPVGKTSFSISAGEEVTFRCLIQNKDTAVTSTAILLGNRKTEQSGTAVSMSEIILKDTASTEVTLRFPKMLRSDTYWYSFVLIDKVTRMPLSEEQEYTWKLSMDQPAIVSVGVEPNQERYDWGTPVELRVELTNVEGQLSENNALNLHVVMKDEKAEICAVLLETPIHQSPTYQMQFPEKGVCTGVVVVTLTSKDGITLDQKMLALQFSDTMVQGTAPQEKEFMSRWSPFIRWGVILLTVSSLMLVLGVAYRRR